MEKNIFAKLRELQEVLFQRFEVQKEIEELPKLLATKSELLNRMKQSYIEKNNTILSVQEKIKDLRNKMEEAERNRENYEKQMDLIKTQREYEALDKEIKDAAEKEQQYRRDLQKEEKYLEEMKLTLEKEEIMIEKQEEEVKAEQQKIKSEIEKREKLLQELKEKESKITPGLDEEILFKFERIIKSKAGLGIVPIKGRVCTGCHMILPLQFVNDVKKSEGIMFCPYCSRILYYPENEEITEETKEGVIAE